MNELLTTFQRIFNALDDLPPDPPPDAVKIIRFFLRDLRYSFENKFRKHGNDIALLGLDAREFMDENLQTFKVLTERAQIAIRRLPDSEQEPLMTQLEGLTEFLNDHSLPLTESSDNPESSEDDKAS